MFMEKVVRTKRVYMKPESKIYPVPVEHLLDAASGNAGVIDYGGDGGDAKRNPFSYEDDDWGDDETPSQPTSLLNQE
jgi:hypothetical protein